MHASTSYPPTDPSGECFLQPSCVSNFREVSRAMAEGRAISLVCDAIEGRENPLRAVTMVEGLFKEQTQDTPEDLVTWYAMGKILTQELPQPSRPEEESEDVDRRLFLATAYAWMVWASGGPKEPALAELGPFEDQPEGPSVLAHLAITNWAKAVHALLLGETQEAKRFYRRALEVGTQFGTEVAPVILWTYGASFFTTGS